MARQTTYNKGFAKKGLTEFYLADGKHGSNGIYIGLLYCQSPFFAKPKTVVCNFGQLRCCCYLLVALVDSGDEERLTAALLS